MTAPRLRPLLTPPNDGTQTEDKLDLRVALKKGAGHANGEFFLFRKLRKHVGTFIKGLVVARIFWPFWVPGLKPLQTFA